MLDAAVSALSWWAFGYAFSFGTYPSTKNGFIGLYNFFMIDFPQDKFALFFFEWVISPSSSLSSHFGQAFAANAATIPSGALAERTQFTSYIGYAVFVASWSYPVVAHCSLDFSN